MSESDGRPGRRLVVAAETDVDRGRNQDFLDRFEELEKLRLLPITRTIAEVFSTRPVLDDARLEAAILRERGASSGAERRAEREDIMRDLGYVWRPGATLPLEPGIPGLMDYMRGYPPGPARTSSDLAR